MPADNGLTQPYTPDDGGTVAIPLPRTDGVEDVGATRVALVAGSGPHLSTETDSLRRVRLKAAAAFLLATLGLFLLWRIAFGGGELWPLNVAIMLGIGSAASFLYDPKPIPHKRLCAIEATIFGLMVVYLAVRQYHSMVYRTQDGGHLIAAARGSMISAILLMFVYAMFIPNTWRSALRVVVAFSMVPVAVKLFVFATHPAIFRVMAEGFSAEAITENIAFMTVAASLATYGTHVLNGLRAQAFEAKQLNQYRLVTLLGSGGMGDVYLAEHRMMKRPCALKRIHRERSADPRSLARFEREVRATSRLSHPNTVEVFDYGQTQDGTFYYVMEYLPGLSLQDLVDKHGPLPPGRVIYLLRQACGALAEAHSVGLVHRDLKPANIFAAQRGGKHDVAKILDFGLVRDLCDESGDVAADHSIQGTPLYMAPEQVQNRPDADHRLDLYALGCVAYTLLTGRAPFDRDTRAAVMAAHASDPVEPPSKYRPEVPEDLERVILRCLSKAPGDRHPDADSVEADLAACASSDDWDHRSAASWWHDHEPSHARDLSAADTARCDRAARTAAFA